MPLGLGRVAMGLMAVAVAATGWLLWQARTVSSYYLGTVLTVLALVVVWAVVEVGWLVTLEAWRWSGARGSYRLPGRRPLLVWLVWCSCWWP